MYCFMRWGHWLKDIVVYPFKLVIDFIKIHKQIDYDNAVSTDAGIIK